MCAPHMWRARAFDPSMASWIPVAEQELNRTA
ncbi:hypothetical protein QF030_007767 [Streptomyces rishiriensis]|uniref:Uncharacterized protein n=1 Tax=Streptomyces rishiriensis TaxID=68264 RepID=A0ABU0P2J9_STRRH|nr:hypothetical protein [Streptomyces rishiriensis]